MSFPELFNFDFNVVFEWMSLPVLDFRLMFVIVAIGIPLALMLLTALVFFRLHVIQRIACVLVGAIMIVFHTVQGATDFIGGNIGGEINAVEFLFLGIALVVAPILSTIGKKLSAKANGIFSNLTLLTPLACVIGGSTAANASFYVGKGLIVVSGLWLVLNYWNCWFISKKPLRVFMCAASIGTAVYVTGWVQWTVPVPGEMQVPAVILIVLGIGSYIDDLLTMSSSSAGSRFAKVRDTVQRLLDTGLLALALFGLSVAFVPVVTLCVDLFLCADFSCPVNTKFNPRAPRPEKDFSTSESLFCDPCDFQTVCPLEPSRMCPEFRERRLLKHPEVPCETKQYAFFFIAAFIVLVVFCIIIMMLYKNVITLCTGRLMNMMKGPAHYYAHLQEAQLPLLTPPQRDDEDEAFLLGPSPAQNADAPSAPEVPPYDPNCEWQEVVESAEPKAASLFQDYKYTFRYFMLLEMFHKLLITLSNVAVAPFSNIATVITFVAHLIYAALLVWWQPLLDRLEQRLSVVLAVCATITAGFSIGVWQAPEVFNHVAIGVIMIFVNAAIPVIASVILFFITLRSAFGQKEYQRLRKDREKKLEEQKKAARRRRLGVQGSDIDDSDMEDLEVLQQGGKPLTHEEKLERRKAREEEKKNKEKELTPEEQAKRQLNSETKGVVLKYFVYASAPLLIVALVLTLFATLNARSDEFVDGSLFFDRSIDTVLNGYDSMDAFTSHCCCLTTDHPQQGANITERWVCEGDIVGIRGQRTIDRARRSRTGVNDGTPIRGLCGVNITEQCNMTFPRNFSVDVQCDSEWMESENVTVAATVTLW